jgi:methylenetetrahydrofolate dehydrogenase (NADP+)/methenyltetrahydrofolate cyclohydrolase
VSRLIDPSLLAAEFRKEVRADVARLPEPLTLVGFLAAEAPAPSLTYANYTRVGCEDVGIRFELRREPRLAMEAAIETANADPGVHGIIVYYPIFTAERDGYIKDLVDHRKDIEGLNAFWARKLYHDERYVDVAATKKAILPCTPLAIVKLLEAAGCMTRSVHTQPLAGKRVTIFNRSEVVGRPLASMLANDGAEVYSFDVDGPELFRKGVVHETKISRREATLASDIVITGVPSRDFPLVRADELRDGTICVNFSTLKNFADDAVEKAATFIPRVGPMTVTMALRNTLRLHRNFHGERSRNG